MAISIDSKQIVLNDGLINVSGSLTRSYYQVARGERNIQQRGVFGNGECGES